MAGLFKDKAIETEFKEFVAVERTKVGAEGVGAVRPIRWLISFVIDVAVRRVKARAEKDGKQFDEATARKVANEAVDAIGDGTILEWLKNGGFEAILKFIMDLISIFAIIA